MMQMISDFKPEVLLLDLHLPEDRHFTPDFIKSQLGSVPHTLAVSLSNDVDAKALAVSYGAESLLDKMKLYDSRMPLSSHSKATSASQPSRLLMIATPRSLFATPVRVSNDRGTTDRRDRHANIDVGAGHEPRANRN